VAAASATALVAGGLAVASDLTALAGIALEDSYPAMASALGWTSMATGLAGLGTDIGRMLMKTGRTASQIHFTRAREMGIISPRVLGFHDFHFNPNRLADDLHFDGVNPTYTVIDTDTGVRRLNIVVHGAPGMANIDGAEWVNAEGLYQTLADHGILDYRFTEIRMLTCHSAEATTYGPSLAEGMARLANVPVEGFHGMCTMAETLWIPAGDGTAMAASQLKQYINDAFMREGYFGATEFLHSHAHRITVGLHPMANPPNDPEKFYPFF
jgi:hypothetical protein